DAAIGVDIAAGLPSPQTLTVTGIVSGPGGLTKVGFGTAILTQADSYQGQTFVNQGILQINNAQALGTGAAPTVVNSPGGLAVNGVYTVTKGLVLNGPGPTDPPPPGSGAFQSVGGGSTNVTWAGPVQLASDSNVGGNLGSTLTVTGGLSGAANLTKVGLSRFVLPNANPNYSGVTTVNGGFLRLLDSASLGTSTTKGVTVNAGGTLELQGSPTINKPLSIAGAGAAGTGALDAPNTTSGPATAATWQGPITLAANASIGSQAGATL